MTDYDPQSTRDLHPHIATYLERHVPDELRGMCRKCASTNRKLRQIIPAGRRAQDTMPVNALDLLMDTQERLPSDARTVRTLVRHDPVELLAGGIPRKCLAEVILTLAAHERHFGDLEEEASNPEP